MQFAIVQEISPEIIKRTEVLSRLADFLDNQLAGRDYGAVKEIIVGVNCVNPKLMGISKDFDTGFLLYKKFTKSKKLLDIKFKLNFSETVNATENEVIDIFAKGLFLCYEELVALGIEGFGIEKLFQDLKDLLQDHSWVNERHTERLHYPHLPVGALAFQPNEKLPLDVFWPLIEKSRLASHGSLSEQVEIIVKDLLAMNEKEIIGFECTLRELLMRANHYNVMAAQKIVEGNVNDDSFLYFRCKLILYGQSTFETAITDPNSLDENIDPVDNGEYLLAAADRAFKLKFGTTTKKTLPRDYAADVIDYNFGGHAVHGIKWEDSDITKRYSRLWNSYRSR